MVRVDLEAYVEGVVSAEMPGTFPMEALKAQAVAARTYAWRALQSGQRVPGHPEAVLSADSAAAQAYWHGGNGFWARLLRWWNRRSPAARAVALTRGEVLFYGGEPILAAYHSSSGGHTESSENYWSQALPYLRGIPDPYSLDSPYGPTRVSLSRDEAALRLASRLGNEGLAPMLAAFRPLLAVEERYPSGRARRVRVGPPNLSQYLTGRAVREALSLRSSWFSVVDDDGERLLLEVRGNGHGVGMSQYGARAMAQAGLGYREILSLYYRGVELRAVY